MKKSIATAAAALGLLLGSLAVTAAPAEAAPSKYSSCAKLRADFPAGVAKTRAAAKRQERTGFRRPAVRAAVYKKNRRLDRDRDLAVCEVRKPKPRPKPQPVDPWITMAASSMPRLEVMDFGSGTSLTVNGFNGLVSSDVRADERPKLSDGTPVSGWDGEYFTDAPLEASKAYTLTLTVDTPAYWDCSIYYEDGCMRVGDTVDVLTWKFVYEQDPGSIKDATNVSWKRLYR